MSAQTDVDAEPGDRWDRLGEGVKSTVITFRDFLKDREKDFEGVISLHPVELCAVLREFYLSLKDKHGGDVSHVASVRSGLNSYFLTIRNIDIMANTEFLDCNSVIEGPTQEALIATKTSGARRHSRQRTFTFDTNELRQIYMSEAMCLDKPESLQNKVFFDVCMYICNRGKDFLRVMTKTDFEVSTDQNGRRYSWLKYDPKFSFREVAGGMPCDGNPGSQIGDRMYERPGDPKCPLASFMKYLTHLHPMSEAFWQRPKRSIQQEDFVWFDNNAIGNSTLNKLMNRITQQSGLQDNYAINAIKSSYIPIIETICRSALLGSQQFRRILQVKESQGHQYMNVRKRHSEGSLSIRSVLGERPLVRGRNSEGHIYFDHMSDTDTGITRCNSASPVLKPVNWEIGSQSPSLSQVSERLEGVAAGYQAYHNIYRDPSTRYRDTEPQLTYPEQHRRNSDQQAYSDTSHSGHSGYMDADTAQKRPGENGIHVAKQKCLEIVHGLESRDIKAFINWMKTFQADKGPAGLVVTCQPVHMPQVDMSDAMDSKAAIAPDAGPNTDDHGSQSHPQIAALRPMDSSYPCASLQQMNGACFQNSRKGVHMCELDVNNIQFESSGTTFCSQPELSPLKICIPTQDTVLMTGVQPDYQILIHTRKSEQSLGDKGAPLESRIYSSSQGCDIGQINSVILRQLENMAISPQTQRISLGETDNKSNCFAKLKEEKSMPMKKRSVIEQVDQQMDQGTMLQTVMEQNSRLDPASMSQQQLSPTSNPMSQHFKKRFPDTYGYSPFEKRQRFGDNTSPREDGPLNLVKQ